MESFMGLLYRVRLSRPTTRFSGPAAPAAERGRCALREAVRWRRFP
jgi:hypothetical protein